MRKPYVGVIGAGSCTPEIVELAAEVGREIAHAGGVLVCGGLGGVMAAAARGAKEAGGTTLGVLPGETHDETNPYIDYAVVTRMGHARNVIIVHTADVLVAVAGGYGTLSEIALALKSGKRVFGILVPFAVPGLIVADSPKDAVQRAFATLNVQPGTGLPKH
jgi:hypothetical protein